MKKRQKQTQKTETTDKNNCLDVDSCTKCSEKILLWTIVANVFLAVLKLGGGSLSGSSGLLADGMQSVACAIASVIVMYSINIAKKKRDAKYPFGYARIEFIVALVIFSVLVGVGLFISISSIILIVKRDLNTPGILALPIAAISVVLTFMMYKYNLCAGRKMESPSMIANGYQSRADMFSSIAVMIGVMLSQFSIGLAIFDKLAALFVGFVILKDAVHHWIINIKIILDKEPELGSRARINSVVTELLGGKGPEPDTVKIKRVGSKFWVGIRLDFPDTHTWGQVEKVTDKIRKHLFERISWIEDVDFFLNR